MLEEWKHHKRINEWLASSFFKGCSVANICISLRDSYYDDKENCRISVNAHKISRRFRSEINIYFLGNKVKRLKRANKTSDAGIRVASWVETEPHLHLHILCEIPQDNFLELQKFVKCFEKKLFRMTSATYIERARSLRRSIQYNGKNGLDSVIDF